MKLHVWLSVLVAIRFSSFAQTQPSVEAFGIKIGQTLDGLDITATEDAKLFNVKPTHPNSMFTNYTVKVTPKSGQVMEVSCRLRESDKQTVFGLLIQKYGQPQDGN